MSGLDTQSYLLNLIVPVLSSRLTFRDAASAANGVFHCRVIDDVDVLVEPVTISVSILRSKDYISSSIYR